MPVKMCPIDIPEGFEFVRFGRAEPGEYSLEEREEPVKWTINTSHPRLIVRKKFEWPSWLKAAAIAMDSDGSWFAYSGVPTTREDISVWFSRAGGKMFNLITPFLKLDPPKIENWNWRNSLIINPNYKE
jgi:hypothetical protein